MSTSSRIARGEALRRFDVRAVDEGPPAVRVVYTCRTCGWKSRPKALEVGVGALKRPMNRVLALRWVKYVNGGAHANGICPQCTRNRKLPRTVAPKGFF